MPIPPRWPNLLGLAVVALLAAGCGDGADPTALPLHTSPDSSGGRPAFPLIPVSGLAAQIAGVTLQNGDGFEVTLSSRECAAQGNSFSVTSPVSAVITANGCSASIGTSRSFGGPYSAGTPVTFAFFSGYTGSPGQTQVSGAYPNWTIACEDGYDGDFNDLVFSVRAFPACLTNDAILDDPLVRQQLKDLLNQSGAFNNNPSARREVGGYMYRKTDGTVEFRPTADPNATPCSMSPGGPQPRPGEAVLGVFHTHPFSHLDPLPANCGRPAGARYDNVSQGGGSGPDWDLIQTPYMGANLPMYIIDKDEAFRLDANTPVQDRGKNPNRFPWNQPGCPW